MDSILDSIKELLDANTDDGFDTSILIFINSALMKLHQLGVGPAVGFRVTDANATWSMFIGNDLLLNSVQEYVYLSVQLAFDPPSTAAAISSAERIKDQLEWRITEQVELQI